MNRRKSALKSFQKDAPAENLPENPYIFWFL